MAIQPRRHFPSRMGSHLRKLDTKCKFTRLGEAVVLMRKTLANSVTPVGWPPVGETLNKLAAKHVQIYACGACSRTRGGNRSGFEQLWSEGWQPDDIRVPD
jgi:DsrE/DsrF/DsrH-like protein